jgi:hypothetical protein
LELLCPGALWQLTIANLKDRLDQTAVVVSGSFPDTPSALDSLVPSMLSLLRTLLQRTLPRGARSKPLRWKPSVDALEDCITPSITIQINYNHDAGGFFTGHADRQSLLQTAANNLSLRLGDALSAIAPSGSNS